jgi:ribosomal protein S27AE
MAVDQHRQSRPWRYRRCPQCRMIMAAGDLITRRFGPAWRSVGRALRECPECGHQAPTREFAVVLDMRGRR